MTTKAVADYVLPAGQTLSASDEDGLWVTGGVWTSATLNGRIEVTAPTNGYPVVGVRAVADDPGGPLRTLTVGPSGSISVSSTIPGFTSAIAAGGYTNSLVKIVNHGQLDVRTAGEAWGVGAVAGGFENHGSLTVNGTRSVTGVSMSGSGTFLNTGTITVSGGSGPFQGATGVRAYNSSGQTEMVNSGSIRVSAVAAPATSVGIVFAGYTTLVNSGLIEADQALVLLRDGIISGQGRNSDVTNTGVLRGEVFLNNTAAEPVVLRNSGRIEGNVTLNTGADTYSGAAGSVTGVVRGEAGSDSLHGGAGSETLQGDAGDDTIDGGAGGSDVLEGGDGVDLLSFSGAAAGVTLDVVAQAVSGGARFSGFERYRGSEHDDAIRGALTADSLDGGAGADTIAGGQGGDRIDGGDGQSYLRGDEGNDSIVGGSGFDDINGNMGDDTASGGSADDWVVGGKDNDSLSGGAGADLVYGNLGDDTCEGDEGNDIVRGGQANDVVRGGAGDDFVSGDRGDDTLAGGDGADVFHSFAEAGLDRVLDFDAAEGDRVRLAPGTEYTIDMVGFDTVISLAGGARMVLVDVSFANLEPGWIFVG